jgi:hypothetical protein
VPVRDLYDHLSLRAADVLKREMARMETSREMPNSVEIGPSADDILDDAYVDDMVVIPNSMTMKVLCLNVQFFGLAGSSALSKVTICRRQ